MSAAAGAAWATLTGNQIGALLTDYLLSARQAAGTLRPGNYIVKTLVTTELMRRIADSYGVQTAGDLLVGFKYIGGEMDRRGPEDFVFGAEESYGFLAGDHVRDKDGAVAAMLLCELAARLKAGGQTLVDQLDDLFCRHGCHAESQLSVQMPGEQGMDDMKALMAGLRSRPPAALAGMNVVRVRDYLAGTVTTPGGGKGDRVPSGCHLPERPATKLRSVPGSAQMGSVPFSRRLEGPTGDLIFFDLEPAGNYVAIRPSGTEPKVKFYMFAFDPPAAGSDLAVTKAAQAQRLRAMEADLRRWPARSAYFRAAAGRKATRRSPKATPIQPSSITNCVIATPANRGSLASASGVSFQGVRFEKTCEKTPRRTICPPVLSRWPISWMMPSRTSSATGPLPSGR